MGIEKEVIFGGPSTGKAARLEALTEFFINKAVEEDVEEIVIAYTVPDSKELSVHVPRHEEGFLQKAAAALSLYSLTQRGGDMKCEAGDAAQVERKKEASNQTAEKEA